MNVIRLRALEQLLGDPSVLVARRAAGTAAGLGLLLLATFVGAALATWTVSDPSLTFSTAAPAQNLMGTVGAAFADPLMQIFGLGAPLVVLPLLMWGTRLLAGRPMGFTPAKVGAGIAALLLTPGFIDVFPVTEQWPLPLGLGGVVGSLYGFVVGSALGTVSGAVHGFVGGLVGLGAIVSLLFSVMPVRRRETVFRPGYTIRRHRDETDEYGLDDTDTYESDASRFAAFRGSLAHLALSVRARLTATRPQASSPRNRGGDGPSLRSALATAGTAAADPSVYRAGAGGVSGHPAGAAPRKIPAAPDDDRDEGGPVTTRTGARFARPAPDKPTARRPTGLAPGPATVTAAAEGVGTGGISFRLPLRGPAARLRDLQSSDASEPEDLDEGSGGGADGYADPDAEAARKASDAGNFADDDYADAGDAGDSSYAAESWHATDRSEGGDFDDDQGDGANIDGDDRSGNHATGREEFDPRSADPGDELRDARVGGGRVRHDDHAGDGRAASHAGYQGGAEAPAADRQGPAASPRRALPVLEPVPVAESSRVQPPAAAMKPGRRMGREAQPNFLYSPTYELPPLTLLTAPPVDRGDTELTEDALEANARVLEGVLEDFGVKGQIIHVRPGPVVTLYELEPAPGIKSSRVIGLADDIARSMSAISARVAVIPGKNAIGIELPNRRRVTVFLRELLASDDFERTKQKLPMCLGKNIGGEAVIADLSRMPHLLVAGTTGSGKSVSINTMILSLLYHHTPETCRIILIDPKMLELSVYDGIPHLLTPVVTDPKKAVTALRWAVREMEDRYRKMAKLGVRNIDGYNARLREANRNGEPLSRIVQTGFDRHTGEGVFEEEILDLSPMPFIVCVVDEMADLMMVAGKDIEGAIQRLAQMARAAGIHLIMATQRPSVDVITGTIKANFPTRISFQVTSKIDSRTILSEMGAEQLLGMGDMLFMAGGGRIQRVHGPFVSDEEVEAIVAHLRMQGTPEYLTAVLADDDEADDDDGGTGVVGLDALAESDDLYDRAVALVLRDRKASTSYVQRRLSIGYNRAATLIERMEREGVVSGANHAGKRDILVPAEEEAA